MSRFGGMWCGLVLLLCVPGMVRAQEPALTLLAVAPFAGGAPGGVCYDPVLNLVYVIDTSNNDTLIYNVALGFLGPVPSPFPAGTSATAIAVDPVSGAVGWLVYDPLTLSHTLWGSLAIGVPAVPIATVPTPPGAFYFGMDIPVGVPNLIIVNDLGNATTLAIDFTGAIVVPPFANPLGASAGVAHMSGPFITHTVGVASGPPTGWRTTNGFTGAAVDNVGVPVAGSLPGTPFAIGFDFGPLTPSGGYTLFVSDSTTNTVNQITYHRPFFRGDVNNSAFLSIADVVTLVSFLNTGAPVPTCLDSADVNDDGLIDGMDSAFLIASLFGGGPPPPLPGPLACGYDPTPDPFRCDIPATVCP